MYAVFTLFSTVIGILTFLVLLCPYLIFLSDRNGGTPCFQRHFLHGSKHIGLHGESQVKTNVVYIMIQDPLSKENREKGHEIYVAYIQRRK